MNATKPKAVTPPPTAVAASVSMASRLLSVQEEQLIKRRKEAVVQLQCAQTYYDEDTITDYNLLAFKLCWSMILLL